VESASSSARFAQRLLGLPCAGAGVRGRARRNAKPRRRLKVSRAAEYRFHRASSVLRSSPLMVRHSSRISRSRSPAAFHCVAFVARSSASAASVSLRVAWAARYSSRLAFSAWAASSACSRMAVRRSGECVHVAKHVRLRQAFGKRRGGRLDLAGIAGLRLQPSLHQRDLGVQVVESAARSARTRASLSPACHEPMMRSPVPVISQTVPSASTRPNRCGSLDTGAATVGAGRPGRGTGRGGSWPGSGFGRGGLR